MTPIIFKDTMVGNDDLLIINKGEVTHAAAPYGYLYENLGMKDGKRVVKEIACNTVVVGGAITSLENLLGVTATWRPATLNDIHGIPAVGTGSPKIALFGAGTGGANLDFGSIIATDIKQRDVLQPIPMRYAAAITGTDADKYFMKKTNSGGSTFSWYLKEFANTPIIKSCWKNSVDPDEDGTEITSEIYDSTNTEGIETFAEFNIELNTKDLREYYEATGLMSTARYNTFGFYTGSINTEGSEYADVRLYSVITFNNRDLSVPSSSSFIYRVYSLI